MSAPSLPPRPRRFTRQAWLRAALAAVLLACLFRGPLLRALVAGALDAVSGDAVAFKRVSFDLQGASFDGLEVTRGGDPLFRADSLRVRYRLRDLLPGGSRRYGLLALSLVRPRLTLVRHADWSTNLAPGGAGAAPHEDGGAERGAPLHFEGNVEGGSVQLLDRTRRDPAAQQLALDGIGGRIVVDSRKRSWYRFRAYLDGDPTVALRFSGVVDRPRGFAEHRVRAAALPLAKLMNYLINVPSARVLTGTARGLDLRAYALERSPRSPFNYHLAGSARIEGAAMTIPGLQRSASGLSGRVDLYDGGVAARSLAGFLAGRPVRLCGAVYGWDAPSFRLGVVGSGPLAGLRSLFAFSRALPVAGELSARTLVEGGVGAPLVLTRIAAPHAAYAHYPIERLAGTVAYEGSRVDLVGTVGRYGPVAVALNGGIALGDVARSRLFVDARASGSQLPYAAQLVPQTSLHASAILGGDDLRLDGRGVLDGDSREAQVAGLFHVDPSGEGAFGPLSVRRAGGASLAGTLYLHRLASESGLWLEARDYPVRESPLHPRLPNLGLAPPDFSARLSGALAGVGTPATFRVVGSVRARDMRVGRMQIDRLAGILGGAPDDARFSRLSAVGPWGRFRGLGGYADGRLALSGHYAGTFADLASLTGDVGGRGPVEGPFAVVVEKGRTVVQASGARTGGASVRGVPVDALRATLGIEPGRVRVYTAGAEVAGGRLAAAGGLGGAARVGVALAELDAARLGRIAPLGPGRVGALGEYGEEAGLDRFDGALVVGARIAGLPVVANGSVRLAGRRLELHDAQALAGRAFGTLEGRVEGLGLGRPRYDIGLHLRDVQAAPFAAALAPGRRITATVDGDVRLRQAGAGRPAVSGELAVPEGALEGMPFEAGDARFWLGPAGLKVNRGSVTVGSTRVAFAGTLGSRASEFDFAAPAAHLADFDDLFDAGDALDGQGSLEVTLRDRNGVLRTNAHLAVAGLRYRRFELGDAEADWTSRGRSVSGAFAFAGPAGRLDVEGNLDLGPGTQLGAQVEGGRFVGRAALRALDLDVWLPALGYQLPVGGHVDAEATLAGSLARPSITTVGRLSEGRFGRFPVDSFTLAATSTRERTTITDAELRLASMQLTGSGTVGMQGDRPVAVRVQANSENLGDLAANLFGARYAVSGSGKADMSVEGPLSKPGVSGRFDISDAVFGGVSVPQALGTFRLRGRRLVLNDAEIAFRKGALSLAGALPLTVTPLALGPAGASLALNLSAGSIDLADFAPWAPRGSTLAGVLDGHVQLSGTAENPVLSGEANLRDGAVSTPFETVPLEGVSGRLTFDANTVQLHDLHARAGAGTVDLQGRATLPELVHPGEDAVYEASLTAAHATLDVPAYGTGQVDADLTLGRVPGEPPALSGTVALNDAAIPFSALVLGSAAEGPSLASGAAPPLPFPSDLALNVQLSAGRNVRIRSSNVDIGGQGALDIGGTGSHPRLSGAFSSTGGTLTYVNTVFRVLDGKVTFDPKNGILPTLDAHAAAHVIDPDPNLVRNSTGTADVSLALSGPVTNLNVQFGSDPPYARDQILGLLVGAPALGATNLFGPTGVVPYGSTLAETGTPPPGIFRSGSGDVSVGEEAFGVLNAQFTRNLLAPLESGLGGALGLSNLSVNVDYTGNVGLTARKILGKNANAVYGTTIGYPYRQTFGFEVRPSEGTAAQATVFETLGAYGLDSLAPITAINGNQRLTAAQPLGGTAGFSLSLQRLLW